MLQCTYCMQVMSTTPATFIADRHQPASTNCCIVYVHRLVLATSKHIGGVMEGAAAVNDGLGRQCVERAAQAIAWEDWVPLEGGAQFAQGLYCLKLTAQPNSFILSADCVGNSSIEFVQLMKNREGTWSSVMEGSFICFMCFPQGFCLCSPE